VTVAGLYRNVVVHLYLGGAEVYVKIYRSCTWNRVAEKM
jgi:hypothetical protein